MSYGGRQLTLLDQMPEPDPITHARNTDPDTSHAAARQLSSKATMLNNLMKQYRTGEWMTAEEAAEAAGYTAADGAWKRISDLLNQGLIVDTGERRQGKSGRLQRVLKTAETP